MKEFTIQKNEANQRFDKYLRKLLSEAPSSMIYKFLRKKTIVLNDKKATGAEHIIQGDVVKLYLADETFEKFAGTALVGQGSNAALKKTVSSRYRTCKVQVLYEDEDIILLDKPAGILSQKAVPTDYSVVDYVMDYALERKILTAKEIKTFQPGICNRLDRNTSGMMAAGVSLQGLQMLNKLIQTRELEKYYLAIVKGKMPKEHDVLTALHTKDCTTNQVTIRSESSSAVQADGKAASRIITEYEVIASNGDASLLKVHLVTGHTHQIRAHLASIGHPLAGDLKYGDMKWNQQLKECFGIRRQMLHSYELHFPVFQGQESAAFRHLSGREFVCQPKGDFLRAMEGMKLQAAGIYRR